VKIVFGSCLRQASVGVALESLAGKTRDRESRRFCAMFGYTEAELHQMSCGQLSHPEDFRGRSAPFQ